jgi:RNA polymerase sigma-70 factor (ECF subfamily)
VPTDEEYALGVQQGDLNDLTRLVERHHNPLIGFLYRMTGGDRTLAEDLAQETFVRVMHSIGLYQHPRPFKAWLYAIATNITRDYFKRAEIRRAADMPDEDLALSDDERPEEALAADDEERRVAAALLRLPDHQREVVILRYYQELSLNEIAEALNIPVGTVKSRLSLGLDRLRAMLEEVSR